MTIHCHTPTRQPARFTVERAALHPAAVFLAKSIVERRNTIPILSNVAIYADADGVLRIMGTDLDMQAVFTMPAAVERPGAFTVDAAMLADILKSASRDAQITFAQEGERVFIMHGRARNGIPTLPLDDFPVMADGGAYGVEFDGPQLVGDVARLAPFMGDEERRYYLNGVAVHPAADGASLAMSATCGTLLARIVRPMPIGAEGLPSEAIIPRKAVAAFLKLAKKCAAPIGVDIDREEGKAGRVAFSLPGARIVSKLIDGTFPDVPAFLATAEAGRQRLAFYDLEPGLSPASVEAFRKALGTAPDVDVSESGFFFSTPAAPEFIGMAGRYEAETRGRFTHELPGYGAAVDYLVALAERRGFDVDAHRDEPDNDGERRLYHMLKTRNGLVVGLTVGKVRSPDEDDVQTDTFKGPFYQDGAFSIPMPRERAGMAAAVTIEGPDGLEYAVRTGNGAIELSAAAVRRIAGDVDPATFVDIPARAIWRGKVLAPGWIIPKPPKLAPRDALRMTAAEQRAFVAACQPIFVGVPEAAQPAASGPVAIVEPVPAFPEPEALESAPSPVLAPQPADLEPIASDVVLAERLAAVEARLAAIEAGRAPVTVAAPANDNASRRVRSDQERRAILRAWRMRSALRAERAMRANVQEMCDRNFADGQEACRKLEAMRPELAAAEARAVKAEGRAWHAEERAGGAERRAARMVRIAADHRKAGRRAAEDMRGARAEARVLMRRLEDAQRAAASRDPKPQPAAPTDSVMAVAFAAAGRSAR